MALPFTKARKVAKLRRIVDDLTEQAAKHSDKIESLKSKASKGSKKKQAKRASKLKASQKSKRSIDRRLAESTRAAEAAEAAPRKRDVAKKIAGMGGKKKWVAAGAGTGVLGYGMLRDEEVPPPPSLNELPPPPDPRRPVPSEFDRYSTPDTPESAPAPTVEEETMLPTSMTDQERAIASLDDEAGVAPRTPSPVSEEDFSQLLMIDDAPTMLDIAEAQEEDLSEYTTEEILRLVRTLKELM